MVKVEVFEVEVEVAIMVVLNGACWGTFRFVMLSDIEAEGPEYAHRIGLIPHVNISLTMKLKVGVALLDGTVLDADVEVVGVERTDPGRLMVGETVEGKTRESD